MLLLALRLILKDKGGKQHCLVPFVGSNLMVELFWKRRNIRKGCIEIENWGTSVYFILRFWGNSLQSLFNCFFVIKQILKALFSFIPWLLNLSDLPNYGSNSGKRYTLRLLSKCLVRSILLPIGDKIPPTLQYSLWFSWMGSL